MPENLPTTEQRRSQILSKFGEVSHEYYEWESNYCAHVLDSLATATQPVNPGTNRWMTVGEGEDPEDSIDSGVSLDDLEFTTYERRGEYWDYSTKRIHTILHVSQLFPNAAYESCAPLNQNILHGDDPNYMLFVPHADVLTFSHEDHALEYKALAWQEAYRESDTLAIVTETARRLHLENGILPSQIDDTEVLPLILQTTSTWGAVWTRNHSDQITWPGSSSAVHAASPDVSPPHADDLRGRLQDLLSLWCPKIDCLQGHCFAHNVEQTHIKKDMSHTSFRCLSVTQTCGNNCISENLSIHENDVRWTVQEVEDLRTISYFGTPMTPCDLAMLCRKPCYEVALVCLKYNDFHVPFKRPRGRPKTELPKVVKKPLFGPEEAPEFVPNQPCSHSGPCATTCPCTRNKAHCTKNCRCVLTCPRRLRGCKCPSNAARHVNGNSTRTCTGKHCPCWASKRECDPELCVPCTHIAVGGRDMCRNMQIQTGRHAMTAVKTGKFGLGLILVEDVIKGSLITEYIGELIYEPTFICHAFFSGNHARFINHAPSNQANVAVTIMLVHGEQRIGVYAKKNMTAGSELFMDYGPEYPIDSTRG
ncbi:hypothetical protein BC628DRAFT_1378815 [Trametes gibbosa]|nr:hypothetical protein BC628DRAFT_1378815 [Trametes gibbosa]